MADPMYAHQITPESHMPRRSARKRSSALESDRVGQKWPFSLAPSIHGDNALAQCTGIGDVLEFADGDGMQTQVITACAGGGAEARVRARTGAGMSSGPWSSSGCGVLRRAPALSFLLDASDSDGSDGRYHRPMFASHYHRRQVVVSSPPTRARRVHSSPPGVDAIRLAVPTGSTRDGSLESPLPFPYIRPPSASPYLPTVIAALA
ncbi:hypothetical protein DFH07DRAFT_1064941, partial [Mycena maculata]